MIIRRLLSLSVLALTGYLVLVLAGHLWDRHSQETQALGFSGIYDRYLGSSVAEAEGAQQVLIANDPKRFWRPPYLGHKGWVAIALDTKPDWALVAESMTATCVRGAARCGGRCGEGP